jgi:hypothetical protein
VSSCLIFDANAWIFLFTGANRRAGSLVEAAIVNDCQIIVNQYLLSEVFLGLDNSGLLDGSATETAKDELLGLWREEPGIETTWDAPGYAKPEYIAPDEYVIDVAARQRDSCNTALAMVLDVQVKDAPYVALATRTECYHRSPRIFTNDEAFAALDPAAHNLPNISVEYIPNENEDRPLPDL